MKSTKKDIVDKLFEIPKKDKGVNAPHYERLLNLNHAHQIDTLYLPDDNGFKYALVVVDVGTRLFDAEPMKNTESDSVVKAIQKIYKRDTLKKPSMIQNDNGSEFKADFADWLKKNKIYQKTGKPYRHRQVALAEYKNKLLGKELFKRMVKEEMLTGVESTQWVKYLPKIVKSINNKIRKQNEKIKEKKGKMNKKDEFACDGDACNIIPQGTKVRVILDAPRDYLSGKRLHGNFRASDIRFDPKPKTVTAVIIKPYSPTLYIIDNDNNTAYTKSQLQIVEEGETMPEKSNILPKGRKEKQDVYIVDKIVEKIKKNGRVYYVVKWKGFDDSENTEEPRTKLIEDVPELVKEFEKSNGKK